MAVGTISIIIFICWILYRENAAAWLLDKCIINENRPRKKRRRIRKKKKAQHVQAQAQPQAVAAPVVNNETIIVYENRAQLESRAANIKTAAGYRGNIWQEVRSMTNAQLIEIIKAGF